MTWFAKGSKADALYYAHVMICWGIERGPEDALRVLRECKGEETLGYGFALIDRAIVKASREMRGVQ